MSKKNRKTPGLVRLIRPCTGLVGVFFRDFTGTVSWEALRCFFKPPFLLISSTLVNYIENTNGEDFGLVVGWFQSAVRFGSRGRGHGFGTIADFCAILPFPVHSQGRPQKAAGLSLRDFMTRPNQGPPNFV